MQWAILSGIEGNLAAYEAVLQDIRQQRRPVTALYILGDMIGLNGDNETVIRQLQSPRIGTLKPQVCIGWWEGKNIPPCCWRWRCWQRTGEGHLHAV